MQPKQAEGLLALLDTIQQGLAYLQNEEDAATRQAVTEGRQAATREIEEALGDTLARRLGAGQLDDAQWLGAMYRIIEQLCDPLMPANTYDREFLNFMQVPLGQQRSGACPENEGHLERVEENAGQ